MSQSWKPYTKWTENRKANGQCAGVWEPQNSESRTFSAEADLRILTAEISPQRPVALQFGGIMNPWETDESCGFFPEINVYVCWCKFVQTHMPICTKCLCGMRGFTDFLQLIHGLPTPPSYREIKNSLTIHHQSLNENIFALNKTTRRNNTTGQEQQDPNLSNLQGMSVNYSVGSTNLFRDHHNTWEVLVTQLIENTTNWQTGLSREY